MARRRRAIGLSTTTDARFQDRSRTRSCVATREAAMIAVAKKLAAGMTQHNRVMIRGRPSNSRQAAYSAAIIGRGFAQAPMAERPVVLPPESGSRCVMALLFQPAPPPCVRCGIKTVVTPAFEDGQRAFVIRCPGCGHSGMYSLNYSALRKRPARSR